MTGESEATLKLGEYMIIDEDVKLGGLGYFLGPLTLTMQKHYNYYCFYDHFI